MVESVISIGLANDVPSMVIFVVGPFAKETEDARVISKAPKTNTHTLLR
jgi:hypothetical protein